MTPSAHKEPCSSLPQTVQRTLTSCPPQIPRTRCLYLHHRDSLPIDFLQTVEPPLPQRQAMRTLEKTAAAAKVAATLGPWLRRCRVPLSLALGDQDGLLGGKEIGRIREAMGKKTGVAHEIRIYEDQVHGFAFRGDWSSGRNKEALDDAEKQGIEWFDEYL